MGMFSKPKAPKKQDTAMASDDDEAVRKKKAELLAKQEQGGIKQNILTSPTGVAQPGYNTSLGGGRSLLG